MKFIYVSPILYILQVHLYNICSAYTFSVVPCHMWLSVDFSTCDNLSLPHNVYILEHLGFQIFVSEMLNLCMGAFLKLFTFITFP